MNEALSQNMNQWQRRLLLVGVVFLVAAIIDGILHPEQFFRSYLLGYMFWTGLSLGCAAFLLLNYLTGGNWGFPVRRPLEAGVRTLPLMIVLILPLFFGMHRLFIWTHKDIVAVDPTLQLKSIYLNIPFFLVREAIYFAFWLWITYRLVHCSMEFDRTGDIHFKQRLEKMAGWALVAYALTVTFFAIDWVMSLEAHWFSTIYGLIFIVIQVQAAIAFSTLVSRLLSRYDPIDKTITPKRLNDLGNLLLTFIMLWAYLAFSQFLIIWSGDLLNEIPYYVSRMGHGWAILALALLIFYFAVPFFLLLLKDLKRHARTLARVCAVVLVLNFADLFWMIVPSFHPNGPRFYLLDGLLTLGIGAVWLAFYIWKLKSYPLVSLHDSGFVGVPEHGD
jgi:hypothetical protein